MVKKTPKNTMNCGHADPLMPYIGASPNRAGCWFYVKVGSGNLDIYVDTGNSGFAIPQQVGKKILVEGKVIIKKTGPMIQAQGVEIK